MRRKIIEANALTRPSVIECYVCAEKTLADPMPIGWESEVWHGDLRYYCPKHRKVDRPLATLGELVRCHGNK